MNEYTLSSNLVLVSDEKLGSKKLTLAIPDGPVDFYMNQTLLGRYLGHGSYELELPNTTDTAIVSWEYVTRWPRYEVAEQLFDDEETAIAVCDAAAKSGDRHVVKDIKSGDIVYQASGNAD